MRIELFTIFVLLAAVGGGVILKQLGLPLWVGLAWAILIGGFAYWFIKAKV